MKIWGVLRYTGRNPNNRYDGNRRYDRTRVQADGWTDAPPADADGTRVLRLRHRGRGSGTGDMAQGMERARQGDAHRCLRHAHCPQLLRLDVARTAGSNRIGSRWRHSRNRDYTRGRGRGEGELWMAIVAPATYAQERTWSMATVLWWWLDSRRNCRSTQYQRCYRP